MVDLTSTGAEGRMLSREEEGRRARLRQARVAAEYRSARAASADLDLPESSYRSHENGQRPIKEDAALLYAQRFNLRYEWLWSGAGDMRDKPPVETPGASASKVSNVSLPALSPRQSRGTLPILGRAQGGNGGEIVLDGSIMGELPGPSGLDGIEGAYGLEVVGESMEPRYQPGEIVWVHPLRAVHKGDYAVFQVRRESGELTAFVKRFVRFSNDSVVACQLNPEGELVWDRDTVERIHLIVASGIR